MPLLPIKIPINLLSDPIKIINQKTDRYYEEIFILPDNGKNLRKSLMLNDPPNYFNPFLPYFGNNNIFYNPFFTNDPNNISLNMNGYLMKRFMEINKEEDMKFFSKKEKSINNKITILKTLSFALTPLTLFLYMKLKQRRFLFFTFLNFLSIPYTNYISKFIFYNSYLRNFNGYSDEQVDFILTVNSNKYKQNNMHQLPQEGNKTNI